MSKLLVDSEYRLQKFPGKGGWTYAEIPEVVQNRNNPFGWVQVSGSIDSFKLEHYKLMPMGNGRLFLPVRAEIRKKIRKEAGDLVRVKLYEDNSPIKIPDYIRSCFQVAEDGSFEKFINYPEGEKKEALDWIHRARSEGIKAERISIIIDLVVEGKSLKERKNRKY